MNEMIFFLHIVWVSSIAYLARKQSLAALTSLMVTYGLLGNLMVLKQMVLFGLSVTTADVYAVGVILVLNYIREQYDNQAVFDAMLYSFVALFLFAVASYFQLQYIPIADDTMSGHYDVLLQKFPKIVMVSASVYLVVQYLDNLLFSWLKYLFSDQYFIFRIFLSLVFSQVLDTVLFTVFGLGDFAKSMWDIIIFSSMIKILCSFFMVVNTSIIQTVFNKALK